MLTLFSKFKNHAEKEAESIKIIREISSRIKHPEWLCVRMNNGQLRSGPDQSWYIQNYRKQRGCGPTTAALITAYIARKPDMVSLYKPYKGQSRSAGFIHADYVLEQEEMLTHMNDMWRYVKPTPMGLWRSSMMSRGLTEFTADRGIPLDTRRFLVSWLKSKNTKLWQELLQFISHNLVYDIPIAWLIYDKGKLSTIQPWHWVSIIGIKYTSDYKICTLTVVDHQRQFDVELADWFKHCRLGGAFTAFRPRIKLSQAD